MKQMVYESNLLGERLVLESGQYNGVNQKKIIIQNRPSIIGE